MGKGLVKKIFEVKKDWMLGKLLETYLFQIIIITKNYNYIFLNFSPK